MSTSSCGSEQWRVRGGTGGGKQGKSVQTSKIWNLVNGSKTWAEKLGEIELTSEVKQAVIKVSYIFARLAKFSNIIIY